MSVGVGVFSNRRVMSVWKFGSLLLGSSGGRPPLGDARVICASILENIVRRSEFLQPKAGLAARVAELVRTFITRSVPWSLVKWSARLYWQGSPESLWSQRCRVFSANGLRTLVLISQTAVPPRRAIRLRCHSDWPAHRSLTGMGRPDAFAPCSRTVAPGASDAFSQRPLYRPSRPFARPTLKGSNGLIWPVRQAAQECALFAHSGPASFRVRLRASDRRSNRASSYVLTPRRP
jgi:hypothetical protein